MEQRFDNESLEKIIDASLIYMCACPAQVAKAIKDLRALYDYQLNCISQGALNDEVHQLIARTAEENHKNMEDTLDHVLTIEQWDRETLEMPEGLRQLRDQILGADE